MTNLGMVKNSSSGVPGAKILSQLLLSVQCAESSFIGDGRSDKPVSPEGAGVFKPLNRLWFEWGYNPEETLRVPTLGAFLFVRPGRDTKKLNRKIHNHAIKLPVQSAKPSN
jgi:hypothetical protein